MMNMIKAALFLVFAIGLFVVTEPYMIVRASENVYTVDKIDKLTVDTFVFNGVTDVAEDGVTYYKCDNVSVKGDYVWLSDNLMKGEIVRVTFDKDDVVSVDRLGKGNEWIGLVNRYYF